MGFWIFMLCMVLLTPITMLVFSRVFKKMPPYRINYWYGYRTARSMQNDETWAFAHAECAKVLKVLGWCCLIPSTIVMLVLRGKTEDMIGYVGAALTLLQLAAMFCGIIPVEQALKREFDRYGRRRTESPSR